VLSHDCELFAIAKRINSLAINQIHSSTTRVNISATSLCALRLGVNLLRSLDGARNMPLTPLPAHTYKSAPRKVLSLPHIRKRGGWELSLTTSNRTHQRRRAIIRCSTSPIGAFRMRACFSSCTGVLANCGSRRSAESRTGCQGRSGAAFLALHL